MEKYNVKIEKETGNNKKSKKSTVNEEVMHPLEVKYGKEPPLEIKPEDRWQWH